MLAPEEVEELNPQMGCCDNPELSSSMKLPSPRAGGTKGGHRSPSGSWLRELEPQGMWPRPTAPPPPALQPSQALLPGLCDKWPMVSA